MLRSTYSIIVVWVSTPTYEYDSYSSQRIGRTTLSAHTYDWTRQLLPSLQFPADDFQDSFPSRPPIALSLALVTSVSEHRQSHS